ncbi:MAG: Eco57I restriction-modification methylase domain-containing protein, partial [Candidatus Poribacteria bacterium]|nr:Eco57I restriction-modification methylase domain-containing protein [Candidatus Poribacteria bacterium]
IYGVDIQPIATTIAKLRFFISLVIEQESNDDQRANYGIRPLPNLETKFVAANTLIGLKELNEAEFQLFLENEDIQQLRQEITELRSKHFGVNTRQTKLGYIKREKECREQLAKVLAAKHAKWCEQQQNRIEQMVTNMPSERAQQQLRERLQREYTINEAKLAAGLAEANRIADWDSYDQNVVAEFFEPEWMFGVKDGFDIAIGNPPYIRHEKIRHLKPTLQIQFEDFFTSKADISVYFYKSVAEFLNDHGILTYISTNKFLRSDYGENLRQFLTTNMLLEMLLDLGNVPIFKAAVDTCITLIKKCLPTANHSLGAVTLRNVSDHFNLRSAFEKQSFPIELTNLSSDVWAVAPPDAQALLKKLRYTGNTLGKCSKLHMGLKTGRNEAFVIDADTRDRLIDADARSEELIKPLLKGETVCKWKTEPPDEYLILMEKSNTNRLWPWSDSDDELEAEEIFAEHYPAIFDRLSADSEKLSQRQDQGKYYWELRSCAYYTDFDKPKIVYPDISKSMRACYDTTQVLCLQTAYILPTDDLSLLAILNSRIIDWYARYRFQSLNDPWSDGGLRFFVQYMEKVPIANRTPEQKTELSQLVEQILEDPANENVRALEKEIDALVYRLYGLTRNEIALIEQTYRDAGMAV